MLRKLYLESNLICQIKSINSEPLLKYLSLGKKYHSPEFLIISTPYIHSLLTAEEMNDLLNFIRTFRELKQARQIINLETNLNLNLSLRQSLNKVLKNLSAIQLSNSYGLKLIEQYGLDLDYIRSLQQRFWQNKVKLPEVKILEKMLKNHAHEFENNYEIGLCLKVTKRHGGSVKRNQLKRRIRDGFASVVKELFQAYNQPKDKDSEAEKNILAVKNRYFLIIPKAGIYNHSYAKLVRSLKQAMPIN